MKPSNCPRCSAKLNPDSRFCSVCGVRLDSEATMQANPSTGSDDTKGCTLPKGEIRMPEFSVSEPNELAGPASKAVVSVPAADEATADPVIQVETTSPERLPRHSRRVEIKDRTLIKSICSVVPGLAAKGLSKMSHAKDGPLYKAVIPNGAKLSASRDMNGAVRGIYHDKNGIGGQANLVEAHPGATLADVTPGVMKIASQIVGQYYMCQIDSKLGGLSHGVQKISGFQNNEFKSKVMTLVDEMQRLSENSAEILKNENQRKQQITELNRLRHECIQLLHQANLALNDMGTGGCSDFQEYADDVSEAQSWCEVQETLLAVLYTIADWDYALNSGEKTRTHCNSGLRKYTKEAKESRKRLGQWHEQNKQRFGIHYSYSSRRREGIDRAVHWVAGQFDKSQNYQSVSRKTINMITDQRYKSLRVPHEATSAYFNQDVTVLEDNGKYYYLLPETD